MQHKNIGYRLLKYTLIFITAFIPVIINRKNILEKIISFETRFYTDLTIALFTNIVLWELVRRWHNYLNQKIPVQEKLFKRMSVQILSTILFCLLLIYTVYFFYCNYIVHVPVSGMINPKADLLVILLEIIFVNMYFFGYQFYHDYNKLISKNVTGTHKSEPNDDYILVQGGQHTVPVKIQDIATIYLDHKITFVKTFQQKIYLSNDSVSFYEGKLPNEGFFRINRQLLVNKKNIRSFKTIDNGKIEVAVASENQPAVISHKNASAFRNWMKTRN